ncbi:uncharacterized protein CTRU02_204103 [Colletotrichum truncatum]|uniref:Uncharacterized protein n=1 Tax=Colletotrichum truncatum TaxID=5467 RepID=A0ACC3ZBE8_COLTU|nr:uncharacterized protein CTRU02_09956 [Colletotrichum truncatum]KAF6787661.1 hypothetical protein CTRU02_09956 [Colletotrichum truncatum]
MRLFLLLFAFLRLFLTAALAQDQSQSRQLPANLQVDLVFPRANETYSPTQWFPIVFDVTNLDAVWPLDLYVDIEIYSMAWRINGTGSSSWQDVAPRIDRALLQETFNSTAPGRHFFHTSIVNMTNATTDQYVVRWALNLGPRCFDHGTIDEKGWSSGPKSGGNRVIVFNTSPNGQLPDIEATMDACPVSNDENSVAVRVTDAKYPSELLDEDGRQEMCPVFTTGIQPETCIYKPLASELAANVSAKILDQMGCQEGTWQTITAPCQKKESKASSLRLGSTMIWALLVLVLAECNTVA